MSARPRVLLLHGLWMPGLSMHPMASRLREAGFATEVFGYPGARSGPAALPALVERLQGTDAVVAHSLGGVMTLEALRQAGDGLPVQRVVCLGSPLCGSEAARGLARHRSTGWLLGRSGALLHGGCRPWRGAAQVGAIAGDLPLGLGAWFGRFDGPHDGAVAVAETRLEGLSDHTIVRASHSGLLFSRRAAEQAAHFLRHGRFRHGERPAPAACGGRV